MEKLKTKTPIIILALSCFIYALSYFHRASPSVLSIDIMRDLSLTPVTFGMIGSFTMLGYAIAQIPSGILTDRIGGKKTLVIYQLIAAIAVIAFAFSQNLNSALAARFILGFSLVANVPAMKILAEHFSASQYSKATGILLSFGSVGSLMASGPLAYAPTFWGWRPALIASGVMSLIMAILTYIFLKENVQAKNTQTPKTPMKEIFSIILKNKNFLPAFIWCFCTIGVLFVLSTMWMGAFYMQGLGFSRETTGLILSTSSVIPLIANPLIAILSDSVLKSRKMILRYGSLLIFLLFLLLTFAIHSLPRSVIILCSTGLMVAVSTSIPIIFTLIKESLPPHCLGTAFGIINSAGPVFAFVMQIVFGQLVVFAGKDNVLDGYALAFTPLAFAVFISFLITFKMYETCK